MNTDSTSLANDEIELELAMHHEHAHSKKFRDRTGIVSRKKHAGKKDRKRHRSAFDDDDFDGYDDEQH